MLTTIDEFQEKKMMTRGQQEYLLNHLGLLQKYAYENFAYESRNEFVNYAFNGGTFPAMLLLKHIIKSNQDRLKLIVYKMLETRGRLDVVVGAKGSGKTYITFLIGYYKHLLGEQVYWFGIPCDLPGFIAGQSMDITRIPPNCTVIMDEAALRFFSRDAMKIDQSSFMKTLAVERQKGRNFLMVTQHLKLADVNFYRLVDSFLFTSHSNIQDDTNRIRITDDLKAFMPSRKGHYLYVDNYDLIAFKKDLERWWREDYSTPYREFRSMAEVYRFILALLPEMADIEIVQQLEYRSHRMSALDVAKIRMLCQGSDFKSFTDQQLVNLINMGFNELSINEMAEGKTDIIKGRFTLDPMQNLTLQDKLSQNPGYELKINYCINDAFLGFLTTKIRDGLDIKLSLFGIPGTGKSSCAISLSLLIYSISRKPHKLNIYDSKEALMKDILGKRNEVFILDEVFKKAGEGSGREREEFQNMEKALRQNQIHFIHASPSVESVMHYYILETAGYDETCNMYKLLVYTPEMQLLGYITVKRPSAKVWEEYQKFKAETLAKVESRKTSERDYVSMARKVRQSVLWLKATNKGLRLTVIRKLFPNLGVNEREELLNEILLEDEVDEEGEEEV